ncbi:MAG TPA: toxin-antitoxin system, antitoxin component, Xre family protein [Desulfobulbus sp.]|nr:toxin-antitoxin system, antitoxin component, Xre family protein [Desulfobulbus sp.]
MQAQEVHTQQLFDKIQRPPPEKVAVVDDFVDFLESRSKEDSLIKAAEKLSEQSFQ